MIVIVGEAWGREEEEAGGKPFVGSSGRILNSMLAQAGINRSECYLTNVFNLRPQPTNDVKNLCGPKDQGIPGYPSLSQGKYVDARFAPELDRLFAEINDRKPNLIIAFGATPAWALLRTSGIRAIRGAPALSHLGCKVLPTYHPAAVMRDWSLRPIVLADLDKAKREAEFPEVRRPEREIWIEPSIEDVLRFEKDYIVPATQVAEDIENIGRIITCVGFATDPQHAIVIPFYAPEKPNGNYWDTFQEEREAWIVINRVHMWKEIIFQNGCYDINHLWRTMGLPAFGATHDPMLLHHALQPELQKGLGFLGSIYTNEAAWKVMRKETGTIKRED